MDEILRYLSIIRPEAMVAWQGRWRRAQDMTAAVAEAAVLPVAAGLLQHWRVAVGGIAAGEVLVAVAVEPSSKF